MLSVSQRLNNKMPKQMHATTLTPYALSLLKRAEPAPQPAPEPDPADWISTTEAAKLTGYCDRNIRFLCESGFFVEGKDWKQRPPKPGISRAGNIRIRKAALEKLNAAQ